ncbi:ArsR/SmtB family transcription factor [Prescottella subtropica]|uniref:ArsR/SmtB family transcription factor n=1 Tax=Prescottella subtropica TaxID=2545757 RepID=UPI0010F9A64B|nr:metalloregulator ArsR/SmtB family transcription factor [Prescottella subtropica]
MSNQSAVADGTLADARMFKALGDPVRLQMLGIVAAHESGEACVCDISGAFELSQPTVSHHLKVLREAGLVEHERRGTWVYYRIVPAALERLSAVLRFDAAPAVASSRCAEVAP